MHMNHSDSILAASFFDTGALKLLLEGGIFMWPLLALLILAIAVIIEVFDIIFTTVTIVIVY